MKRGSGVSAIILAAGMSTRMGTLKQLLPFDGKTLLENVLETVRATDVDEIILVLGFSADAIQRQIPLDSAKVLINKGYREGMGSSIRLGISNVTAGSEGAIIVLADQPSVRGETINRLIAQHRELKPPIVIPFYRGIRGNPVLIDRSVFPELMKLSGDIGCRAVFANYSDTILKVPVDDPGVLFDVDSPIDLEKIVQE